MLPLNSQLDRLSSQSMHVPLLDETRSAGGCVRAARNTTDSITAHRPTRRSYSFHSIPRAA